MAWRSWTCRPRRASPLWSAAATSSAPSADLSRRGRGRPACGLPDDRRAARRHGPVHGLKENAMPKLAALVLAATLAAAGKVRFLPGWRFGELRGAVVGGSPTTLKRLGALKPEARPEVARALAAAGTTLVQAVFVPPADARKVFEEVMPALPDEVGGG